MDQFSRTRLLIGQAGMEKLRRARVAVFGLGGVGGHGAEALCRCGIGSLDLFDNDTVSLTNLNRQLIATRSTLGQYKTDAMRERLLSINPDAVITPRRMFYMPDQAPQVDFAAYDYILDCIDTVTAKLDLIVRAQDAGTPIISALGAGNRMDPACLRIGDLYETENCPLARVMRRECRKRGVRALTVAYSTEPALRPLAEELGDAEAADPAAPRRDTPGSMPFVPSVMGLMMAARAVRDILEK